MELGGQPAPRRAHLVERRVATDAQHRERVVASCGGGMGCRAQLGVAGAHAGSIVRRRCRAACRRRGPNARRPRRWATPSATAAACTHAPVATASSASASDTGRSHRSATTCRYAALARAATDQTDRGRLAPERPARRARRAVRTPRLRPPHGRAARATRRCADRRAGRWPWAGSACARRRSTAASSCRRRPPAHASARRSNSA